MPFLFDGYNLYHAARKLYEPWENITASALCGLIAEDMRFLRDKAIVVFDGKKPRHLTDSDSADEFLRIIYSGGKSDADSTLEILIQQNTAPRRLSVVSSDNRLRRAARKRRALSLTSAEYLQALLLRRQQASTPRRREPKPKFHGLAAGQADQWLTLFGLKPDKKTNNTGKDAL